MTPHPKSLPATLVVSLLTALALASGSTSVAAATGGSEVVFSSPTLTPNLSLALERSGTPHLAFSDVTFRYATLDHGDWRFEDVIEGAFLSGRIAVDAQGRPGIFFVRDGFRPEYAERRNGTWTTEFIDRTAQSVPLALAIDGRGRPHTLDQGGAGSTTPFGLFYAVRDGGTWTHERIEDAAGLPFVVTDADLELDVHGDPVVAYASGGGSGHPSSGLLRRDSATGAWSVEEIPVLGTTLDLALAANGDPSVVFDTRPGFVLASFEHGAWRTEVVDATSFGAIGDLGLDGAGRPVFSIRKLGFPAASRAGIARRTAEGWSIMPLSDTASEVALVARPSGEADYLYVTGLSTSPPDLVFAIDGSGSPLLDAPRAPREDVVRTAPQALRLVPAANGVRLDLSEARTMSIDWYDVRGRRVASVPTGVYPAGSYDVTPNEEVRVAPGVYFVRLSTERDESATARVVVFGAR
jgi:hypothetical protein